MDQISFIQKEINIKKYKKVKRISKIGCGFVYQVEMKRTGELFVAKILDCNDDEEQCNKIIRNDINKIMALNHPTIIKFIGYSKIDFQGDNNITLIIEQLNESLSNVLQKIRENNIHANFTNTTRQIILAGICDGMKYLHKHNIVHSNLNPNNILLDLNFFPHITNFYLSDQISSQMINQEKLPYIAPEILNNDKYDEKADVYSFGIIMYEIVTNLQPFPLLSKSEIDDHDFRRKIIFENYRPNFDQPIKSTFRHLIERCLSKNSKERPSFDELFDKLTNKENLKMEENYILDKVYKNELDNYIHEISSESDDFDEKIFNRLQKIEKENEHLKNEINKQKIEIDQQNEKITKIDICCQQIENENKTLEKDNQQQNDEINLIENYYQQLDEEIRRLRAENDEKINRIKTINKENQQIQEQINVIKNND